MERCCWRSMPGGIGKMLAAKELTEVDYGEQA
jgi:hypothetical protein